MSAASEVRGKVHYEPASAEDQMKKKQMISSMLEHNLAKMLAKMHLLKVDMLFYMPL